MLLRSLSCPHAFAVHCRVDNDSHKIHVGIMALADSFEPGVYLLYTQDERQCFSVTIPDNLANPAYGIELTYAPTVQDIS